MGGIEHYGLYKHILVSRVPKYFVENIIKTTHGIVGCGLNYLVIYIFL